MQSDIPVYGARTAMRHAWVCDSRISFQLNEEPSEEPELPRPNKQGSARSIEVNIGNSERKFVNFRAIEQSPETPTRVQHGASSQVQATGYRERPTADVDRATGAVV